MTTSPPIEASPAAAPEDQPARPDQANPETLVRTGRWSRWRPQVITAGLYGLLAWILLWPASLHPNTTIVGNGDAEGYLWVLWKLGDLIAHGHIIPLNIPDVVWPYGSDQLLTDGYLPTWIGGLFATVLPPILAYNVFMWSATMANMWAARRLATRFTDSATVAVIVGLAFASAPALFVRIEGHLTLYAGGFIAALLVTSAVDAARRGRVHILRTALLLNLAYMFSIYYLVFGGIAFGIILLAANARWRQRLVTAGQTAASALLCAALMTPWLINRLHYDAAEAAAGAPKRGSAEAFLYTAEPTSVLTQPSLSTFKVPGFDGIRAGFFNVGVENVVFPGFLLLAGLGGLLLLRSQIRRPILLAALTMWILSLGPGLVVGGRILLTGHDGEPTSWLPYRVLLALPGLGLLRAPSRASWVLAALLAVALAGTLGWMWQRWQGRLPRGLLVTTCGLLILLNLQLPNPEANFETTPATEAGLRQVAADPDQANTVVYYPQDCDIPSIKLQYLFRHPALGCQAEAAAIGWYSQIGDQVLSPQLAAMRCNPAAYEVRATGFPPGTPTLTLDDLRIVHQKWGVRYLIVNKALLPLRFPSFNCALAEKHLTVFRGARVLGEDQRWTVLDLQPLLGAG